MLIFTPLILFWSVCATLFFRVLIFSNAFLGMDKDSADQLVKAQPFIKRLLMTYIWKCNSTGKQRLGFATWFLICRYIHILSSVGFLVMPWYEIIFGNPLFSEFFFLGLHVTSDDLLVLFIGLLIFTPPVSLFLAAPFLLCAKKKSDDAKDS